MLYDRPPLGGPAPQQRQVSQQQRMPQQGQMQHQGQQKGQQQGEDKKEHDVSQQVLCPPERFIGVPTSDLQEAFRAQFSSEDYARFNDICKLFDANSRLDFITVSRRVQDNFRLFSAAARGVLVPMKKGGALPTPEQLDQTELRFLEDFCNLMVTAHYRLLTEQEWQTATDEEFTFNMPIEVTWEVMDTQLLQRFWSGHPRLRRGTAHLQERVMVFHRGIHTAHSKGLYVEDKIDLLMGYLVVNPLAALMGTLFGWKAKEKTKKYSPLTANDEHAPVADLSRGEGQHDYEAAQRAGLEHPNAKVVRRVTLQRLMPDAGSVFSQLFSTLHIQEPCFTDLVILYRKSKQVLERPGSEKDPLPNYSKGMAQRNIVIKSFSDVPMADVEMIFPEKKVFIKPFVLIQLVVTVVLAIITVVTTLLQNKINLSVLASLTSIAAARAAQVWSRAQLTRQQMQDAMTQGLYEKAADSQEGVLHTVLNQMSDQHTKEVILAYAVLLIRGEPVTQEALDKRCEIWLDRVFGLKLDFAIENSLPVCLEDGVITRDNQGTLTPLNPTKALAALKHKWEHHFDKQTSGGEEPKVPGTEPISQERPYDMSITTETHHPEPQAQPIPPAARAYPTTVTQRRPNDYEQGSGQLTGAGAGQYAGSGQYTGAGQSLGSGQFHGQSGGTGQYTGAGQSRGSGSFNGSGQTAGTGQFAATGAVNGGSGPVSNVAEQGYSSSPRFSSTPVDWSSSPAPTTAATGTSYMGTNPGPAQPPRLSQNSSNVEHETGSTSDAPRHPHLDKMLHPVTQLLHKSG